MNKYYVLCLFSLVIMLMSCSKESEINTESIEPSNFQIIETNYYLDGKLVPEESLNLEDESLHIAITGSEKDETPGKGIITVNTFSSKENYIEWGILNGLPVAQSFEIEEHLSAYAETNGYIEEYEKTGVVSQSFLDYQKQYFDGVTQQNDQASLRAPTMLHKDFTGGASTIASELQPFMFPGWNNRTSRYYSFHVYTGFHIFDRSFYRRRMATLWNFGWQNILFQGPLGFLNDRLSSCISIA